MNAERSDLHGWPAAGLALAPGEIHLWMSDYARLEDERLLRRYWEMLEEGERRRRDRYHFAADRQRDLVTRALLRSVLSLYEPLEPHAWRFRVNNYGRPQADSTVGGGLVFNISHTRSLILLGVTRRGELGVDIENTCVRSAPIALAERYFAAAEAQACIAAPLPQQAARFWDYWTLKESYIKARGLGLSLPLDGFSFHFPTARSLSLQIDPALADEPARWRFWLFSPAPSYVAAVCAERSTAPVSITLRDAVPLRSAVVRPLTFTRVSDGRVDLL